MDFRSLYETYPRQYNKYFKWKNIYGVVLNIKDIEDDYLLNINKFILKKFQQDKREMWINYWRDKFVDLSESINSSCVSAYDAEMYYYSCNKIYSFYEDNLQLALDQNILCNPYWVTSSIELDNRNKKEKKCITIN